MKIREVEERDIVAWSRMRTALWPNTQDNHLAEIREYFNGHSIDIVKTYVAEVNSIIVGFIELNLRNFAEGSRRPKVPYVEAWYVDVDSRGNGYGLRLMQKAEHWALSLGYSELASDTDLKNSTSIDMHKHLGFEETERIVCFIKRLTEV